MTTEYRITAVRAADGGARLLLAVEKAEKSGQTGKETLVLHTARLSRLPRVGTIGEEEHLALVREAELCRAMELGLRQLSAAPGSPAMLKRKLRAKGVDAETAEEATRLLAQQGYLSETAGAVREAEKGLAKLWGNKRILMDVRAKGYGDDAMEVVRERLKEENAPKRCAKLIKKRRMVPPRTKEEAAKFAACLVRYGYTSSDMKEALTLLAQ